MRTAMVLFRSALGAPLLVLVASCAQTPQPAALPPTPAPKVVPPKPPAAPPPVAAGAAAWDELPVTEGGWVYDPARRAARFVDDSGLERASLACIAAGRTMRLALPGERAAAVEILSSAGRSSHGLAGAAADFAVSDVALDRIAFSRGRFALRASALLVLPVQAEIGRAIEDCRR